GAKLGLNYKINGRHYLTVNGLYQTNAPLPQNVYVSPRTRDQVIDNLTSSEVISGDINYIVRYPKLQARATYFYTQYNNQVWARSFYHDEYRNFVNFMMTDVDELYQGVELGVEGKITPTITLSGAFTTGVFVFNSRPIATITVDN